MNSIYDVMQQIGGFVKGEIGFRLHLWECYEKHRKAGDQEMADLFSVGRERVN